MTIQLVISIPAATDPNDVLDVFGTVRNEFGMPIGGAGYYVAIPPSGIMPMSQKGGGRALVHCVVGCTFDEALAVTQSQRPVWQIMGAISLHEIPNPAYDPDIPETIEVDGAVVPNPAYEPPTIPEVFEPLNASVWNFIPPRKIFDGDGNEIGSVPQKKLHKFAGCAEFEERS